MNPQSRLSGRVLHQRDNADWSWETPCHACHPCLQKWGRPARGLESKERQKRHFFSGLPWPMGVGSWVDQNGSHRQYGQPSAPSPISSSLFIIGQVEPQSSSPLPSPLQNPRTGLYHRLSSPGLCCFLFFLPKALFPPFTPHHVPPTASYVNSSTSTFPREHTTLAPPENSNHYTRSPAHCGMY